MMVSEVSCYEDYEELLDAAAKSYHDDGDALIAPLSLSLGVMFISRCGVMKEFKIKQRDAVSSGWLDYGYTIGGIKEIKRRAGLLRSGNSFWDRLESKI